MASNTSDYCVLHTDTYFIETGYAVLGGAEVVFGAFAMWLGVGLLVTLAVAFGVRHTSLLAYCASLKTCLNTVSVARSARQLWMLNYQPLSYPEARRHPSMCRRLICCVYRWWVSAYPWRPICC
jgi:hypothetical protein|eukprot:COSAG01_NODE_376_length_17942_cov_1753.560164_12_plen_124_part_00